MNKITKKHHTLPIVYNDKMYNKRNKLKKKYNHLWMTYRRFKPYENNKNRILRREYIIRKSSDTWFELYHLILTYRIILDIDTYAASNSLNK